MQGINNYIPEINNGSRVYNVAAIVWVQFMTRVISHAECFVLSEVFTLEITTTTTTIRYLLYVFTVICLKYSVAAVLYLLFITHTA